MLDRIIISSNEDRTYIDFWKIQLLSHKIFFPNVKLTLALLTNKEENDELITKMIDAGLEVRLYKPALDIPLANQAKVLRYYCASEFEEQVSLISDIDTIPLQSKYINNIVSKRQKNKLLAVGKEVLANTPHAGKFPAHHTCGEGKLFKQMYNPNNLPFQECIKSYIGLRKYDHKENIANHPSTFSDESLNRAVINIHKVDVQDITRDINIHSQWLDRSWWYVDNKKLYEDYYIEANLLRPLNDNILEIKKVIDYLNSLSHHKYENI